jgi:hypothetical protein
MNEIRQNSQSRSSRASVEGSRDVTLKISPRDPSVRAGLAFSLGMTDMEDVAQASCPVDKPTQARGSQRPTLPETFFDEISNDN